MIEEPPVLIIHPPRPRPTDAQLDALRGVPTGFLTDAMNGRGGLDPDIKPLSPGILPSQVCATALTCACGPADVLTLLGALGEIKSGDIIIAATNRHRDCAVIGDRVMGMFRNSGGSGLITDGVVRDVEGINEVGLPVFCTGLSPNSPFAKGPGEIGCEVVVGGVSINTGDVIVSDDSGVVVVPFERIDEVIAKLVDIRRLEKILDEEVSNGLAIPDHIASLLKSDQVKRL